MSAHNSVATQTASSVPLDRLQTLLIGEMAGVNALILEKMQSSVPLIPQLAGYLIAAGGKRIRPLLTLACASLNGADMARARRLAACVEFIHTATLLHDDVVDSSSFRRGNPSANIVFGNEASVLVGDFLFSRAFQLMVEDGSLSVLAILSNASAVIAEGEVLQLSTQNNLNTTMADYLSVIAGKTAALFAAACQVGPVVADKRASEEEAFRDYGFNLGMAFQIADDVLDYALTGARQGGKAAGDDFRDGKVTAPVLYALQSADAQERAFWTRTLGERDQNDGDFETAQKYMMAHAAGEKGLTLARGYAQKARASLDAAPNGALHEILCDLSDFAVDRVF